jgi:hypothetical protein
VIHILVNSLGAAYERQADYVLRLDLHGIMTACGNRALINAGRP